MQGHERRRLLGKAPLALKLVRYASRGRYRRKRSVMPHAG